MISLKKNCFKQRHSSRLKISESTQEPKILKVLTLKVFNWNGSGACWLRRRRKETRKFHPQTRYPVTGSWLFRGSWKETAPTKGRRRWRDHKNDSFCPSPAWWGHSIYSRSHSCVTHAPPPGNKHPSRREHKRMLTCLLAAIDLWKWTRNNPVEGGNKSG